MCKKPADLLYGAIKYYNSEAVICHIHDQILTHDGQADEAEISTRFGLRRSADINAGETGAIVSSLVWSEKFQVFEVSRREKSMTGHPRCITVRVEIVERGIPSARGKKAEQGTYIACSDILNNYFFWKM